MLGFENALLGAARTCAIAAAEFFAGVADRGDGGAPAGLDGGEETFAGELAIGGLGTGVLDGDDDVRGPMTERDARGDLVHVLSARPGGVGKGLLKIGFVQCREWLGHRTMVQPGPGNWRAEIPAQISGAERCSRDRTGCPDCFALRRNRVSA